MTEEQNPESKNERRFPFMTPKMEELFYLINGPSLDFSDIFPNQKFKEPEDIK